MKYIPGLYDCLPGLLTAIIPAAVMLLLALPASADDMAAISDLLHHRYTRAPTRQKHLWECLREYAESPLSRSELKAEFWLALAQCRPVLLPDLIKIAPGRSPDLMPLPTEYQVWLLPVPGEVFIFGHPAEGLRGASDIQDRYTEFLRARPQGTKLLTELKRFGLSYWTCYLLSVHEGEPTLPKDKEIPKIEVDSLRLKISQHGKTTIYHRGEILSQKTLEEAFARPLVLERRKQFTPLPDYELYIGVDWTIFLQANLERRQWLLTELQAALTKVSELELYQGGICLLSREKAALWPLADVRAGKWPEPLPEGHRENTLETLQATLQRVSQLKKVHLTFLAWNPGLTMPLPDSTPTQKYLDLARQVRLTVIQVEGKRLLPLEQLAATQNYYDYARNEQGGPSFRLMAWSAPEAAAATGQ